MIVKGNLVDCTKKGTIRIRENSFLVVENGVISKIYSQYELPDALKNEEIEDYGDSLILPGLIDMHLHAPQFAFRGLGMDMELLDWLNTYTFPEEAKYKDIVYAKKAYKKIRGYIVQKLFHKSGSICDLAYGCYNTVDGYAGRERIEMFCR